MKLGCHEVTAAQQCVYRSPPGSSFPEDILSDPSLLTERMGPESVLMHTVNGFEWLDSKFMKAFPNE